MLQLPLAFRLFIMLCLLFGAAAGLAGGIVMLSLGRTAENTVAARLAFIAAETATAVETAQGLGLPVQQLERVDAVIRQQHARNPDIDHIEIVDQAGRVVFSTAVERLGARYAVPAAPTRPLADGTSLWRAGGTLGVVRPLTDSFGRPSGRVEIVYSGGDLPYARESVALALGGLMLGLALTAAVLALPVCLLLTRRSRRDLARLEARLDGMVRSGHGRADAVDAADTRASSLLRAGDAGTARLAGLLARLDGVDAELDRLENA